MAKVTDYSTVATEIDAQLDATAYEIDALLGREIATLCVLNIYMTNDLCTGFGQDFNQRVSIISSRQRISVIVDHHSSNFKDDFPLCQYVDLTDDVHEILMILQAAYDRIQFV